MRLPSVTTFLVLYVVIINLISFLHMGVDKFKAKRRAFRIPEATLFLLAIIGGSIGSLLGMYIFHHKTRHRVFVFGMPAILIIQLALILFLVYGPLFNIVTI